MSRNVVSCEILIKICILFLIVAKRITNASRLSCVCNLAECENVNDADCPSGAGTVWDSCKCCRICARVEHEPCGGPYDFSGFCAAGLECVVSDFLNKNAIGICTRIFNKDIMCKDPKFVSGCNIVNQSCRCEDSESCTEESPFSFKTRQECQMNLNAMLSQKSEYEDEENDEDINISDGEENYVSG